MLFSNSNSASRITVRAILLANIGWSCAGCTPEGPSRKAITGTVTLDGKPATQVIVVFTPTGGGQVGAAAQVVDGKFALDALVGPSIGKHDVTVDTVEPDLEDFEQLRNEGKKPFSQIKIHPRFTKPGALSAVVTPTGTNDFQFDLKSR